MLKHKRLVFIFIGLLILLLAGVTAYMVYGPTGKVVAVRTFKGGLCAPTRYSGPGICGSETKLYANGDFGDRHLSHSEVIKLQQLINTTNFDTYQPTKKLITTCPSATDGSDVGYKFPEKTGDKVFTVCMLDIPANDPLFSYLETL